MLLLTDRARLDCGHDGTVGIHASQSWVTIQGAPILVAGDPVAKTIAGCKNAATAPCTVSVAVTRGYSRLISVDGRPVCLDTVHGPTSGGPPGFRVARPGQALVSGDA
jgi:hypothetical protein